MDSPALGAKSNFTQNVTFKGSDTEYSAEIIAQDVTINCSPGTHHHGSSKVKLTNVVDYNWELRFYAGQLLAVHMSGNIIAYGIKGKSGGMVRVANQKTNQRTLIKDMKGLIQDISFAQTSLQIVLGCVDEEGSLFVHRIDEGEDFIRCTLLMHVIHPSSVHTVCTNYRVIWCPYVPALGEDTESTDDLAKLLVFLNGSKAEIWDVSLVNCRYGTDPLQPNEKYQGYCEVTDHILDVIDASFSPDGTALATASLDGYVKFFQIYMIQSGEPRCLHSWKPHDGRGVSCLFFLDNVNDYGSDCRFWKFAVTGSNYNAELKIWSCESWTCLQTIRFVPNPSAMPQLVIKAHLDMTGQYLLLSDINNRILYVLQIQKNDEERLATVTSISEFLLPASFVSFCITSAEVRKFRFSNSTEDLSLCEDGGEYDEDGNVAAVAINMYVVQPKRLQECNITFQPDGTISADANSLYQAIADDTPSGTNSSNEHKNEQEENEPENTEIPNLNDLQSSVNLLIQQQQSSQPLNLMTPDAFSSPAQTSSPSKMNSFEITSPVIGNKEKINVKVENLIDTEDLIFERPQKDNFASGGSSPSREVQEILSFKNSQEYFDNLNKMDDEPDLQPQNKFGTADNLLFSENVGNDVSWPNIPIMKANEIVKEENRRQELQQMAGDDSSNINDLKWKKSYLQQLNYRLHSMENLMREQSNQIQKLQHDLMLAQSLKSDLKEDFRNVFSKELDLALSRNQLQQAKLFENYVTIQNSREREQQENMLSSISQILSKQIMDKLQSTVSHEIKSIVIPTIHNIFENLNGQLMNEYSHKLNSADHLLKENISKLVSSKAVADSLSLSLLKVIKPNLEQSYKDMIEATLIPSWERVCSTMFQQIHDTFTRGTKEYTASVESYMDRQRRVQDKGKDLIVQIQAVSDTMKNNAERLTNHLSQEIQKQIHMSLNSVHDKLSHTIADLVNEQIRQGFKNHAAVFEDSVMNAVRSRAVTPSPHVIDTQVQLAHIQQLIATGRIDTAFQQALSASDLALVVYVCDKVSPQDVFGQEGCPLQQHVVLSLIQQLSADLAHHTELKHKYIEEAVLNLDISNPPTREHVPIVLRELLRQLNNFITNNPHHKSVKSMRMLQMATQSLMKT